MTYYPHGTMSEKLHVCSYLKNYRGNTRRDISVLDISWIATQNTYIKKIVHQKGKDNTDTDDIRVIAKRDPKARKNLSK